MFGMSEPQGPHAHVFIDSKFYVNVRQNFTYKNFVLLFVCGAFLPCSFQHTAEVCGEHESDY